MGSYKPLFMSVAFLLFMGFVVPFTLGFFVDISYIEASPLVSFINSFIEEGFEMNILGLIEYNFNPFAWTPDFVVDYLTSSFTYLSLLPNFLLIICLVLTALSIVYSVLALVRGV
jgi:hypothetical protein